VAVTWLEAGGTFEADFDGTVLVTATEDMVADVSETVGVASVDTGSSALAFDVWACAQLGTVGFSRACESDA
jgi:hypothetical protein